MSRENVEIATTHLTSRRSSRGADAIAGAWLLWAAELEDFRADGEQWIDAGDTVIGLVHRRGRGKASGAPIDRHQFDLWKLRDGKVVRAVLVLETRGEALAAARSTG